MVVIHKLVRGTAAIGSGNKGHTVLESVSVLQVETFWANYFVDH